MRRTCLLALTAALLAAAPANAGSVFTPVTVEPQTPTAQPVWGSDHRYHVLYELRLTNTKRLPATIQRVEVLSGKRVLASFADAALVDRLRTLQPAPAEHAQLGPDVARWLFVELTFRRRASIPRTISHRVSVLATERPNSTEPTPQTYTVAHTRLRRAAPVSVGPPLRGPGWIPLNACCTHELTHRGSVQSINGTIFNAQRFAIDFVRMDGAGLIVKGDPAVSANYSAYDADVIAATSGKVVETVDGLQDQIPGSLPDRSTLTTQTLDGNHIVIRSDDGTYAFYAHLRPGSLKVRRGQRVRRGQLLGHLGNTGNSSAPHLHFHITDGPDVLGSEGLPFVFDQLGYEGRLDTQRSPEATSFVGRWDEHRRARPSARRREMPLGLTIVSFPR